MVKENNVYVIAEVGSNFGGDLETAFSYIKQFAEAGADAIKFQSWKTATLQNRIDLESGKTDSCLPILDKYELPTDWHIDLKQCCDDNKVDFLSTPFDLERARLIRDVGCPAIKIASGDLTFSQLLREVAEYKLPILLSTGMSDIDEISAALLDLGAARENTVLLHCVGAYPPKIEDANLLAIKTLAKTFGLPVGLSDHYPGSTTAIAAVAMGARVIEKHVTFSRQGGHPDSCFAMELDDFSIMVEQIRILEKALGDGKKVCRSSELDGRIGGRRSLYWISDMEKGSEVTIDNVLALRPAKGEFAPSELESLIGKKLNRAVMSGFPVSQSDFANE